MAEKKRVTLIYNENAGRTGESRSDLAELIKRVGFSVTCFSKKSRDIDKALKEPADIVAVAGGDGTIAKVAARMRPNGCPLAVLPLGTANNIAKSLGIGEPTVELVATWHIEKHTAFYPIAVAGPWGRSRIIEGIGFGAIEQAIANLPSKTSFSRARTKYAEAAMNAPAEDLKIRIDDKPVSRSFAVLEVTKFPFVGPNLHLAPDIEIGDPTFSICSIGAGVRERRRLAKWLIEPNAAPVPVSVRQAKRLEIAGRFRQVRIEGRLWRGDKDGEKSNGTQVVVLESEPEPLFFIVPE